MGETVLDFLLLSAILKNNNKALPDSGENIKILRRLGTMDS